MGGESVCLVGDENFGNPRLLYLAEGSGATAIRAFKRSKNFQ